MAKIFVRERSRIGKGEEIPRSDCGHLWEIEHGSGQSQPARCPACASHLIRLRRILRQQMHP